MKYTNGLISTTLIIYLAKEYYFPEEQRFIWKAIVLFHRFITGIYDLLKIDKDMKLGTIWLWINLQQCRPKIFKETTC